VSEGDAIAARGRGIPSKRKKRERETVMGNRLYVGNLPFHATEDLITQKFATCGEVREVALMLDRMTGQSRGFCFVEMATPEGAKKAIDTLNNQDFEGRSLRVDVAQERRS